MIEQSTDLGALSLDQKRAMLAKLMQKKEPSVRQAPTSFTQQRLWILDQLEPGNAAYHITAALRLTGELNRQALNKALNEIVRRHEALRTTFSAADGDPVQVVHPSLAIDVPVRETSGLDDTQLRRQMAAEARRGFDLGRGPLLRASVFHRTDREHVLLVVMHHIISDGWSIGVLIREVSALYTAFVKGMPHSLPDLPIQYADYAAWQRERFSGHRLDELLRYWKDKLFGLTTLELPTDRPRPAVQSFAGTREVLVLPQTLAAGLEQVCLREGVTPFMLYLAAFSTLLHRYSGQDDIVIGSPIANRPRTETEGVIGFFANTLVLRSDLSGNPTFKELLGRTRQNALSAFSHQEMPFERLVEELNPPRDTSRNPLFQVAMTMQNTPRDEVALPGLVMVRADRDEQTAKFDLSLSILKARTEPRLVLEYCTDLFDASTVQRLLAHFQTLLEGVVANVDARLGELPLLGAAERKLLLEDFNATRVDYPLDVCLHELIERQVERTPDAIAVRFENQEWTYRQLNERSNQLAHRLRALGVGRETRVGVCMMRSFDLVAALLGTIKAGAAYVPLDPEYPRERLTQMLEDAAVPVLLTQKSLLDGLPEHKARLICLDEAWTDLAKESPANPESGVKAEDLAYVIFTSGSTGRPKGAMNTHRGIVNRLLWMQDEYGLTPADCVLQKTPFSFDVSVWEFFWPLLSGARLVMARPGGHRDSGYLVETIVKERITTLHFVPSMLQVFLEDPGAANCQDVLRRVICSGEALPLPLQERFFELLPGPELHNLYGPTEAAVDVTYWKCDASYTRPFVPIGRPVANTQMYVLDQWGRATPLGVPGELHIGGVQVGRGYLKRTELTAEKFVSDPFSREPGAKLYKTGDSARWLPEGVIEYLGRLDFQVKIRGFRIELGEIEAVLLKHPDVREAVVTVWEDSPGDKRLAAYLIARPDTSPSGADLRDYLRQKLPDYMVPSSYVLLESFPLSPNGKLDRKALPAPDRSREGVSRSYVAPRTPVEEQLAAIWAEVLKIERVGIEDNFFDLGGHSLLGARVTNRANSVFAMTVPLRTLFQKPTVAELAAWIEEEKLKEQSGAVLPLQPMPRTGDLPLSFNQEALWFLEQLDPGKGTYLITQAARMRGNLDAHLLERALEETLRRQESLRTYFDIVDGRPVQVIVPPQLVKIPIIDLSHLPEEERLKKAYECLMANRREPFDLSKWPLFRVQIVQLAPQDCILLISIHHIIFDGWSVAILAREVVSFYRAFATGKQPPLAPLPVQYADYVLWQRQILQGDLLQRLLGYWKGQLADQAPLDLPTDYPRPRVRTSNGANVRVRLSPELTAAVNQFCRGQGVTPFMALLAVFQAVLHHYCRQQRFVSVGSPVAGRTRVETENVIGYFINMLLLNTDFSGDPTFAEVLDRVRKVTLDALEHQDIPLGLLVTEGNADRDLSRHPRIDVMFVLQNNERPNVRLPGITVSSARQGYRTANGGRDALGAAHAKFDISLVLSEHGGQFRGGMNYNSDLFRAETAEGIVRHFRNLVENVVANPNRPLSQLSILDDEERRWVLSRWQTKAAPPSMPGLVHRLIEENARRSPSAVAVVWKEERLTYGELNARANRLAHYLRRQGVGPDKPVGICLERSLDMVISVLAVLKAGGAYIPLNTEHAADRLKYILETAAAALVLTHGTLRERHGDLGIATAYLDEKAPLIQAESDKNPDVAIDSNSLAYILFTSGSTGRPKGVMINHSNLINAYYAWEEAYSLSEWSPTYLQMANFSFDVWPGDFVRALCSKGKLVLCPADVLLDAEQLHKLIVREKVDATEFVPVVVRNLMGYLEKSGQRLDAVRLIVVGADVWHVKDHERLKKLVGLQTRVLNSYGITEATIDSSYFDGDVSDMAPDSVVPIGKPFLNTRFYILDPHLQPVPIGVPGELFVGGPSLARGYVGRPDLTAEKFINDPFANEPGARMYKSGDLARWRRDGNVEFLGRTDFQVKVSGFRIEPGEIEVVLKQHPRLSAAAVVPRPDGPGGATRLIAYVVAADNAELTVPDLRAFLIKKLPDYMIPAVFVPMAALPMTTSGKIDRPALPAPEAGQILSANNYAAPRTDVEERLCGILSEVLKVAQVGIHDNFFEIGGNSLLAVQVIVKIREEFTGDLPMVAMFTSPTVAGLAERIAIARGEREEEVVEDFAAARRQKVRPEAENSLVALQPYGTKPPLYLVNGAGGQAYGLSNLARALGLDQPVYTLQTRGLFDRNRPDETIEEMATQYLAAVRSHQPQGPYLLGGFSMGGFVALEMGRQLVEAGEVPLTIALIDATPPTKRAKAQWQKMVQVTDSQILSIVLNRIGLKQMFMREDSEKLRGVLARFGLGADLLRNVAPEKRWDVFTNRLRENLEQSSPDDMSDLRSMIRTHKAQINAMIKYKAKSYPHPVLFLKAQKRTSRLRVPFSSLKGKATLKALRKLFPQMTLEFTPGSHLGMIRGENLKVLAEKLNQQIADAMARGIK